MKKKKAKRKWGITPSKLLSEVDTRKLLDHLQGQAKTVMGRRKSLIIRLMLNTGLRVSELCNLRVKDTPAVSGVNAIEVYRGKGQQDRTIPIAEHLAVELTDYILVMRCKTLPRHVRKKLPEGAVFFNTRHRKYNPAAIYKMVSRAAQKAGIEKWVHPHMLRHSFCSNALDAGVEITAVQRMMGHRNLATTGEYAHAKSLLGRGIGELIYIG